MIPERLAALREKMRAYGVDAYLVPTADYHESEYVGTYFKARTYITGFTGSAGTAVITQDEACLWTDGRYFVQAAKELAGTGVTLMKMGQEGVPTVEEYGSVPHLLCKERAGIKLYGTAAPPVPGRRLFHSSPPAGPK